MFSLLLIECNYIRDTYKELKHPFAEPERFQVAYIRDTYKELKLAFLMME